MNSKLDKKGRLVMGIFFYGKKHIDKRNVWDKLNYLIYKILNSIFVIGIFNTEIKASHTVSNDLILYHPYGIVINPSSVIKENVIIRQQVTIGNKGIGNEQGCPVIGKNVEIGAGAKIIGSISIGDNSKIGANAVVTKSFPKNSIIVGVPGKNIAQGRKE